MSDLKIYKASAGSGKTYRITAEYLRLIFHNPYDYRRILAVTFTHKATAEMKGRVLKEIYHLAKGKHSDHIDYIMSENKLTSDRIKERAKFLLKKILHDYSRFYIGTIDSFFQSILRSFTREIGLQGGYEIELDNEKVLNEAVDTLLSDVDKNGSLKEWLLDFAREKIGSGTSWKINTDLVNTAKELFKEDFSMIGEETINKLKDKLFLKKFKRKLETIEFNFQTLLRAIGEEAIETMKKYKLDVSDFSFTKKGVAGFFEKLSMGDFSQPGSRARDAFDNMDKWYTKTSTRKEDIENAVNNKLNELLKKAMDHFDGPYIEYITANQIKKQLYSLGILNDLSQKIREYKKDNAVFMLSETPAFLNKIINNNDSPFIYEKTGEFFRHFMIDEFQDTSALQWNNFFPLVNDSISNNNYSMLVGDVKQSIYRWRNSDWSILGGKIQKKFGGRNVEKSLEYNWRSLKNIVDFNNSFFASAVSFLQLSINSELGEKEHNNNKYESFKQRIKVAYENSYQFTPENRNGGHTRITFIESSDWKDEVLKKLPSQIEFLQDKGYNPKDITILVRTKNEGKEIAKFLLESKAKQSKDSKYKFDIISNEALDLKYSAAVQIILQVMTCMINPSDFLAAASLVLDYNLKIFPGNISSETLFNRLTEIYLRKLTRSKDKNLIEGDILDQMKDMLPTAFHENYKWYRNLPLFDMVEQLISVFSLNRNKDDVPYLQGFQDCILDFTRRRTSDVQSFMNWWAAEKNKQLLKIPDNQNAIKIMTIHKAKGLGIKAVLIPFCEWKLENKGNKSDLIWCKPSVAPFNDLEILPLKYSDDLGKSIFKDDYFNEKLQSWIDNLNLLYVAFTRAEEDLIINVPLKKPANNSKIVSVGNIFYSLFYKGFKTGSENISHGQDFIDLTKGFDDEEGVFDLGSKNVLYKNKIIKDISAGSDILFDEYPVYPSYKKLRLKLGCDSYFRTEKNIMSRNINIGKIKHELFEYIKTKNDIGKAVNRIVFDGKLNYIDGEQLKDQINEAMKNPVISSWFEPPWKVKTEKSILLPGGSEYRPDRVLINNDHAVIIDYKFTVRQTENHKKQLRNYMNYLIKMGYSRVEGFLWYVDQNKVEELIL